MLTPFPFGQWAPDTPPTDGMEQVKNTYPFAATEVSTSYRPVGSFAPSTPALAAAWVGGGAFVGSDGTSSLLSATSSNLYRYSGGAWTSVMTVASTGKWKFAQFGDNIIGVHGGAPVAYNATAGTAAALGGSPPTAKLVTTVRDFVVLGQAGGNISMVQWSGFNNSAQWIIGTNQSDQQPMLEGGEVMGLVGGEYGLILQRNRLVRMTYTGDEKIFQFDTIEQNNIGVGCMAKGSVVQAGQKAFYGGAKVFFLSERGFAMCDGSQVVSIGEDRVSRTFFQRYSRQDIENNLVAAADPRQPIVYWAMPGNPGQIWAYNWAIDRWGFIEIPISGVFAGFAANVSIDAVDGLFPGGIDLLAYSLDDPRFSGGNPLLYVVDPTNALGTLSGPNMAATFECARLQPEPGRRISLRSGRPVTDATNMTLTIDGRARLSDAQNSRATSYVRTNGQMPIRFNAQWVSPRLDIPAGESWSFAQGIELEFEPGASK